MYGDERSEYIVILAYNFFLLLASYWARGINCYGLRLGRA
jgi:hypothetical protein